MRYLRIGILLAFALAVNQILGQSSVKAAQPPTIGGCPVFPADNIWNTPISHLPVDPNSAAYINTIGPSVTLHPDFGAAEWEGAPIGIPYIIVPNGQPKVAISFDYDDESDPGPYPIPPNPPIEGGPNSTGDRHILVVEQGTCKLYETWSTYRNADGSWRAGSGAVFDLRSNALRPDGWTSADAAGLPVLAGLVRYDEVAAGQINHAIRFTAQLTRKSHVWPARHDASSSSDLARPPMGQRFRLKASFDISRFSRDVQVILTAMKTYGIILADNGSNWFISGAPDPRWNDTMLRELKQVRGSEFEAVNVSSLRIDPNSGQARQLSATPTTTLTPSPTATRTAVPPTATATRTAVPPTAIQTPMPGIVFADDFETNKGWSFNPNSSDTATTGKWERGDPQATGYNGPKQLGTTVNGVNDLVTGRLAGSSAGTHDIDGGATSTRSPAIALPSSGNLTLTFSYYLAHAGNASSDDYLRIRIVGTATTTVFEKRGAAFDVDAGWTTASVGLNDFAGQTVYLLVEAADTGSGSLLEAAIDDLRIAVRYY